MSLIDDKEDIKFANLLAEKRHQELKQLLSSIVKNISCNTTNNDGINNLLKHQEAQSDLFLDKLNLIQKPEVNIDLNTKDFVFSVQEIAKEIIDSNKKVIDALENRMLPDTFSLIKGYAGVTESVKVNYKTAKEIKNDKK